MRWASKPAHLPVPLPNPGNRRLVNRFAWRPIKAEDGFTYWLVGIVAEQEYTATPATDSMGYSCTKFQWVDQRLFRPNPRASR